MKSVVLVCGALLGASLQSGALAQSATPVRQLPIDPAQPTIEDRIPDRTGRTANTGAGEVGLRQSTRSGTARQNVMGRLDNRIRNRVQNRIRNRIDRAHDPTANATSPFVEADSNTRTTPRPR